jgi:hypothetical protein
MVFLLLRGQAVRRDFPKTPEPLAKRRSPKNEPLEPISAKGFSVFHDLGATKDPQNFNLACRRLAEAASNRHCRPFCVANLRAIRRRKRPFVGLPKLAKRNRPMAELDLELDLMLNLP